MTQSVVQNEQVQFLLKCVREITMGSTGHVAVNLEFPVGFEPEFEKMKEIFEYFIGEVHINYKHQVFHSVSGTIKNKEVRDIFINHLLKNR